MKGIPTRARVGLANEAAATAAIVAAQIAYECAVHAARRVYCDLLGEGLPIHELEFE